MMKQHAVATYLQLVVGCDRILYDVSGSGGGEFPIDLVGLKGEKTAFVVDIAEKFQGYPRSMRLATLKGKLVHRYLNFYDRIRRWGYQKIQAEVWFFGAPSERLELVLPSVRQILWREQRLNLEVIPTPEVRRRVAQAAEAASRHPYDLGNPFAQAHLLAGGALESPPRAQANPPERFPIELPDPYAIPAFVDAFLSSGYVVDWLGFDAEGFAELQELTAQQRSSVWWELEQWLRPEWHWGSVTSPKYTREQIVGVISWLIRNAARALEAWRKQWHQPLFVEIGYMLPYLFKNRRFPSELIEAEVVRYGGDRDLVRYHLHSPQPEKRFYRGYLRLLFQGLMEAELPSPSHLPSLPVPLRRDMLPRNVTVSLSLLYPQEFSGYFFLTFEAIAKTIGPRVERFR